MIFRTNPPDSELILISSLYANTTGFICFKMSHLGDTVKLISVMLVETSGE